MSCGLCHVYVTTSFNRSLVCDVPSQFQYTFCKRNPSRCHVTWLLVKSLRNKFTDAWHGETVQQVGRCNETILPRSRSFCTLVVRWQLFMELLVSSLQSLEHMHLHRCLAQGSCWEPADYSGGLKHLHSFRQTSTKHRISVVPWFCMVWSDRIHMRGFHYCYHSVLNYGCWWGESVECLCVCWCVFSVIWMREGGGVLSAWHTGYL